MVKAPVPNASPEEKLNWEVEKLRHEVRNLSRTFITAVVLAIAGAVTAGYNIVKAFTDVTTYQQEVARLRNEMTALQEDKEVVTTQLSAFRVAYANIQSNADLSPEEKLRLLPTLEPTLQYAAPDEVAHSTLPARIYVQYLLADREYVDDIIEQLQRANYRVKALGAESSSRARIPTVAYYYAEDEEAAKNLISLLRHLGVSDVSPVPIKLTGSTRPRHFDLWLPRSGS